MSKLEKRYDFVLYFDVKDGNPNGDPDAGNLPRIDAETGNGIVTDVCLKRKVRNYVQMVKGGEAGYDIFVKEKAVLNTEINNIYKELNIDANEKNKAKGSDIEKGRVGMCKKFFDIRTFGAVLTTGANAGQVRGPVQFTFARSVEPIVSFEHSITRMAVTTEKEAEEQGGDNRTMGRKYTVPYGLYRAYGFISPQFASATGFSQEDLELIWQALEKMFEYDRSAARGLMTTRRLVIFEHTSALGSKPADELFNRIKAEHTGNTPARDFSDYTITLDGKPLSEVVTKVAL
ncbi:type I-C CRISPR-associated protein Cas7/Csd2 [Treponema maltophilum]|uniref:type I-C CRISPR-associated protein Cas7/Csd2 n=1 Tax=Treponema maltophilum TaxID=51160 RepID=UPI003D90985C